MSEAETKALLAKYFQKAKSQFPQCTAELIYTIHKDIFTCLFSIHNTISSSCHEQV